MLPAYILVVDISTYDKSITEAEFRELVDPSLLHLDALKGAFNQTPCKRTYYPPGTISSDDLDNGWSVKGVVIVSLGKKRSEYLKQLYKSIAYLIRYELPQFAVDISIDEMQFS